MRPHTARRGSASTPPYSKGALFAFFTWRWTCPPCHIDTRRQRGPRCVMGQKAVIALSVCLLVLGLAALVSADVTSGADTSVGDLFDDLRGRLVGGRERCPPVRVRRVREAFVRDGVHPRERPSRHGDILHRHGVKLGDPARWTSHDKDLRPAAHGPPDGPAAGARGPEVVPWAPRGLRDPRDADGGNREAAARPLQGAHGLRTFPPRAPDALRPRRGPVLERVHDGEGEHPLGGRGEPRGRLREGRPEPAGCPARRMAGADRPGDVERGGAGAVPVLLPRPRVGALRHHGRLVPHCPGTSQNVASATTIQYPRPGWRGSPAAIVRVRPGGAVGSNARTALAPVAAITCPAVIAAKPGNETRFHPVQSWIRVVVGGIGRTPATVSRSGAARST